MERSLLNLRSVRAWSSVFRRQTPFSVTGRTTLARSASVHVHDAHHKDDHHDDHHEDPAGPEGEFLGPRSGPRKRETWEIPTYLALIVTVFGLIGAQFAIPHVESPEWAEKQGREAVRIRLELAEGEKAAKEAFEKATPPELRGLTSSKH